MNYKANSYLILPVFVGSLLGSLFAHGFEPVPMNPFLADSPYPISHYNSAQAPSSRVAGFGDVGRPLRDAEISWQPTEAGSANIRYSGKYPNGQRVAWLGGNGSLFKFQADTMELLAKLEVVPRDSMTPREIVEHVNRLDTLTGAAFIQAAMHPIISQPAQLMPGFYNLISSENEQYLGINDVKSGRLLLRVYGDAVNDDPASNIVVRRELVLPSVSVKSALVLGVSMTYDGVVILQLTDGTLYAISRDLKILDRLKLPRLQKAAVTTDGGAGEKLFSSYIRNGTAIDDDGGIYIVTNDYMHRVQWTGDNLSLDEKDGAWTSLYDSGQRGSGTTPNLMGWGDDEDKLVLIGAGLGGERLLAFWRDKIPEDWQPIKGYDRRVAAVADIDFGERADPGTILEITQTVKGYGTFMMNSIPERSYADDAGLDTSEAGQFFAMALAQGKEPKYTNWGGLRYDWNPDIRKFQFRWRNSYPVSFTTTVSAVDDSGLLYAIGTRDDFWTLEGVDWNTGESKFHYKLGKSQRFNPAGASLNIAPDGAVHCACSGGLGVVRIKPIVGRE